MTARRSYLSNYIKIYLWQALSVITSLLSLVIVIPQISASRALFGIYSVCVSATVFLSYADFGFLTSGFRFANESLAKGDKKREVEIVGFVSFVLISAVGIYALGLLWLARNPQALIADLSGVREVNTATALLFALAVFSPVIVLQRVLQIIFGIRVEDYVYQRINVAGNIVKIASVFFFINDSQYNIVGYFVWCQVVGAACAVVSLIVAKVRYSYDLWYLVSSVRFNKAVYAATKRLAFASLYVTFGWVLYYELDTLFLGRALGANQLAPYAIALGAVTFFRTLSSIVFSPFVAPIQRLAALENQAELRACYRRVMIVTLPAVVFPALSLFVLMQPFMLSWVGSEYITSVAAAQLLLLAYVDGFSRIPASYLLVGQERVKELYWIGTVSPVVLWGGVLLTFGALDGTTFAGWKLAAAVPVQIFSLVVSMRCLDLSPVRFFSQIIRPALLPCMFLTSVLWLLKDILPSGKSGANVGLVVITGGVASLAALVIYYLGSFEFRKEVTNVLQRRSFLRQHPVTL